MPRIVHFEIHADDAERAVRFYQEMLGWTAKKWEDGPPYWLLSTGDDSAPGINGGLLIRRGPRPDEGQPVNAFVCTADVPNLDHLLERVAVAGGSIAVPKLLMPGVGWLAYIKDTEGNILGLMEADKAATGDG